MAGKNYRSANNRPVDMDTLRLKNEDVRAVGNMNVNARGDRVNNENKTVDSRNKRISRQYKKQTNVVDQPVAESIAEAKKLENTVEPVETKNVGSADISEKTTQETTASVAETAESSSEEPQGLAAAIARAKEVKQEEMVPPRQAAQQKPGVKKI